MPLADVTGTGTTTAIKTLGCKGGSLHIYGNVTAFSVDVEGSQGRDCDTTPSGCVFDKFTTHTAKGISDYDHTAVYLRANVTSLTP